MAVDDEMKGDSIAQKKLELLYPVLTSMVIGDFDVEVQVPEVEDELTPVWVGLKMMVATLREKINELEEVHEQTRKSNSKLRRVNRELSASLEENKALVKTLHEIVHLVLHDLNSPIRNLKSLIELKRSGQLKTIGERDKINELIEQCVQGLEATWLGLRSIVYERDFGAKAERVSVSSVWIEVVASMISDLNETNPVIEVDFSDCEGIVYPRSELKSILQNFLSNSIKYRDDSRKLTIQIKTLRKDGGCVLEFRDNGIGIDLEKNKHLLFKPLQRFAPSVEGTGMGLHLIYVQVQSRGGRIDVESKPGAGSTFKVYIPQ